MQKSTNYELNLPERNDQYNIDHFNENAEKIDAALRENAVNIGKNANDIAALQSSTAGHADRTDNPHSVTKSQVGLGNVPNVTTNNQTPTFSEATSLTALESGENMTTLFGKLKKAVSSLISHISNTDNPHNVTAEQVGLGNVDNKSSATIRDELTNTNITDALGYTPEDSANKGVADGYASLGSDGKVPSSQLPNSTEKTSRLTVNDVAVQTSEVAKKSLITLNTLMAWLIKNEHLPSGENCFIVIRTTNSSDQNDILQFSVGETDYELPLVGVIIEFMGSATDYQTGVFRLRIHSNPKLSYKPSTDYTKFPDSHIAEYTCNGKNDSPSWKMLIDMSDLDSHVTDTSNPHSVTKYQIGLDKVENTRDSDKRVAFAENAGDATNAAYATDATNATYATYATNLMNSDGKQSYTGERIDKELDKKQNALGYTPEDSANKGVADGYASLGSDGKVPNSQLPTFVSSVNSKTGAVTLGFSDIGAFLDKTTTTPNSLPLMGNVATKNMNSLICDTAASTQAKKIENVDGFTLFEGATVRVLFKNGNTSSNPTLNVNSTGAKNIVAYRGGSVVNLVNSIVNGSNKCFDAYTTLELVYDGTDWVVMGNPVLMSDFGEDSGYIKYANGLIYNWYKVPESLVNNETTYPKWALSFTSVSSYVCVATISIEEKMNRSGFAQIKRISSSEFLVRVRGAGGNNYAEECFCIAIGY